MSEIDEAHALNDAVQKLRISYEQYFAGVERFEPLKERDKVKKELRRLMTLRSNNTAFRFRVQTTQATLVTYETHWNRIVRQIEEGTFKRDKLKAQRREQALRDATSDVDLIEDDVHDLSDDFEEITDADDNESAVADLLNRGVAKPAVTPSATTAPRPAVSALFESSDDLGDLLSKPFGAAGSATAGATVTTGPRSPTGPTESTAPNSPIRPTSPTRPMVSTAPTSPTGPTATTAPTSPMRPTASTAPTGSTSPIRPTSPTGPTASTAPRSPTVPTPSTAPRSPTATTAPRPSPSPSPDPALKKLHEAFTSARAQTGESKSISMETLAETVRKQTAAVKQQLGCNDVEFKVAIKDGKAVLKAVPK